MSFLSEDNGNASIVRVGFVLCIIGAIGMAFYGLYKGSDILLLTGLCGTFLTTAYAGKVAQKGKEENPTDSEN